MTDKDEDTIFEKYKWTARQINLSMEEADSTDVAKDINEDLKSAIHRATLSAKQEQLAEDIKKLTEVILKNSSDGYFYIAQLEDSEPPSSEQVLNYLLDALQQSKAKSD